MSLTSEQLAGGSGIAATWSAVTTDDQVPANVSEYPALSGQMTQASTTEVIGISGSARFIRPVRIADTSLEIHGSLDGIDYGPMKGPDGQNVSVPIGAGPLRVVIMGQRHYRVGA